jgi:hypothetical protein
MRQKCSAADADLLSYHADIRFNSVAAYLKTDIYDRPVVADSRSCRNGNPTAALVEGLSVSDPE